MKSAKQINILSETEVPFEVGAGFGSDYNIDLNAPSPSIHVESSHGMNDVTEVFEDDNYIVATAKYGDVYTKGQYTHRFARNNYTTDRVGNIYTGETIELYDMTTARMPGYMPITFKRDMLALVWNDRSPSSLDRYTRYTGDAYCIKRISAVVEPQPSSPGYVDIIWYMYAKEISEDEYSNSDMLYLYGINSESHTAWAFTPTSHSRVNVSGSTGYLDLYNNEADAVICSQEGLISWIRLMFSYIGDTGATSTKIINYITDNMPYGGILTEPSRLFVSKDSFDNWSLGITAYTDGAFSTLLNPIKSGYHWLPASGNPGKQWIIPFDSEEEYHATCCAKQLTTFPYSS